MILGISSNPNVVLLVINVLLLVLGMVMEPGAILTLMLPVLLPIANGLGLDLVHFGVMVVLNLMIGQVTPPFGVCLFVMILGGFLGIVTETGALDAGIAALVHKLKGNELVLIPILMAIFSIGGTTYGMCEETVPFYLLLAATMVAAGFDSLTGAAVVLLLSLIHI